MMYIYTILVPKSPLFLFFGLHTQKKNDAEKQKMVEGLGTRLCTYTGRS